MRVKLWGTRGDLATPGAETEQLGGNTTCLEIDLGGPTSLIIDGGTGIIEFGASLPDPDQESRAVDRELHLIVTHFHRDHVIGFPFFSPIHDPAAKIHVYSAHSTRELKVQLRSLFDGVYSPLRDIGNLAAEFHFHLIPDEGVEIAGARVRCSPVDHGSPCYAVRVDQSGTSLCYSGDHEARDNAANRALLEIARGVDLLIHDGQFTAAEYEKRAGWGHSSIERAIENGRAAGARKLLITHHDPSHSDELLFSYFDQLLGDEGAAPPLPVELAVEGEWVEVSGHS